MYIHGIYMFVHLQVLYILYYTLYSLYKYMYILISPESQQDFVVNTVIKNSVLSLHRLLPRRIRTRAVPALKMEIFLMVGQTQKRQKRPSASLCLAWRARRHLVLKVCIPCLASCLFQLPPMAAKCLMLQHWKEVLSPKWTRSR
jgi:hypothetical protein